MGEQKMSEDDISRISEKIIASKRAWEGGFLKIDDVEIELPDGKRTHHMVARHPGAVAVIAIDEMNRVLLVRQYRTAIERVMLEIPAGKLDPGEAPYDCAVRELSEETGYCAGKLAYLVPLAVAPGYCDEVIHLFMATQLTPGQAHPDEGEFVVSEWMPLSDLVDMVLDGKIEDSKTIIAALICDALSHRM